ncbi:MAG TPA: hypothetical protein VKR42_08685 [Ktedonobacteraceae bacterium]|nr:hypothetical protein [Ktedonobacteraceae bacterium]
MLAIIDYGLIAVFFVILFGLVLLIARTPSEEQVKEEEQARASLAQQKHVVEYGVIVALLGFFLFLTVLIEHSRSHSGAS